jgi:iron only hydrogenase large subunit-like protein
MEAALRTACWMITGEELHDLTFRALRGLDGIKQAEANIDGLKVKVAVVNGLGNARKLLEEVKSGKRELHFMEVMTCPGGCIGGGGQPYGTTIEKIRSRMESLYKIDRGEPMRQSHQNPWINRLYQEFLGEPLGEKSHHLLHTSYARREVPL